MTFNLSTSDNNVTLEMSRETAGLIMTLLGEVSDMTDADVSTLLYEALAEAGINERGLVSVVENEFYGEDPTDPKYIIEYTEVGLD